tara:strand:+ start:3839 stop:4147 length:309 start_codon:yes stop_codon:yes gene_type:complete
MKIKLLVMLNKNDLELLQCPISMTLFYDPVIAEDGFTYEKDNIELHFLTKKTSPMTNINIETKLIPNIIIKQLILHFIQNNSNLKKNMNTLKIYTKYIKIKF